MTLEDYAKALRRAQSDWTAARTEQNAAYQALDRANEAMRLCEKQLLLAEHNLVMAAKTKGKLNG